MYTGALTGVKTSFQQSTRHERHKRTIIFLSYQSPRGSFPEVFFCYRSFRKFSFVEIKNF